jgi:phosphoribosyl 1,2-cyclic phosphodiesterase
VTGLRLASLASSSNYGNCYLVEGPGPTRILIDYGARQRRLEAGLARLGIAPGTIDAVLLTHEHGDHTYCLSLRRPLLAAYGVPLHAHQAIWSSCPAVHSYLRCGGARAERTLAAGQKLNIGSLEITPFATPHDASSSLGFRINADGCRLGVATDLGHVSAGVARHLYDCDMLVIESNHDREMEMRSGRPWPLIERVLGDRGHLSNEQAAAALRDLVTGRTRAIMLAHLSLECNTPAIAVDASASALARSGWRGAVCAAPPDRPSAWLEPAAP